MILAALDRKPRIIDGDNKATIPAFTSTVAEMHVGFSMGFRPNADLVDGPATKARRQCQ